MNRHTLIGLVAGLILGVFIGYQAGSTTSPKSTSAGMPPPAINVPPAGAGDGHQARIASLQSIVARDPKNVQAWVQLGNDYFDTHQPQKAVEAYGRALELEPHNPDVLTDQGIMYRELGQFEKAIENFQKANRADPKHVQSLFNMGVVLSSDLKQPTKAIEVWTKVIQVAPQSDQAAQARRAIDELKGAGAPR